MPWVKLDDGFPFHRKAILVGKDGLLRQLNEWHDRKAAA